VSFVKAKRLKGGNIIIDEKSEGNTENGGNTGKFGENGPAKYDTRGDLNKIPKYMELRMEKDRDMME